LKRAVGFDDRAAAQRVAERDGEGIGGVRGGCGFGHAEKGLYHHGDLLFGAAAEGGDEFLNLGWFVDTDGKAGLGSGENSHSARFADGDGRSRVAEDEVFDGDLLWAVLADDSGECFVDADEFFGVRRL